MVDVPVNFRIDVKPGVNNELREVARGREPGYFDTVDDVSRDDPVYSSYSTGEEWDNLFVDLEALEWWHDNDFNNHLNTGGAKQETKNFVNSIKQPEKYPKAHDPEGGLLFPDGELYEDTGTFSFERFKNASTAKAALDDLHIYLFAWERNYDEGTISTEDEKYAAALQESLDRYTDLETHVWAFDLLSNDGGTHGNGFIWDETNDELLIMETVPGQGQTDTASKTHAPLRNATYLQPNSKAYERFWHPIRFDGTRPQWTHGHGKYRQQVSFKQAKREATRMFMGMTSGGDLDNKRTGEGLTAPTTQYLTDVTKKLRNYNQNSIDFQELYNQSKMYNKALTLDQHIAIGGTVENPEYWKVNDEQTINQIWKDEAGKYDDLGSVLDTDTTQTLNWEEADQILDGPAEPVGSTDSAS